MENSKENSKTRKKAPQAAPAKQQQPSQEAKKGPVKTIRVEDVSASIWARERQIKAEMTVFYSVTFERSYRDSTGQWRYTRYFDLGDLGKVVSAAQQADEFVRSLQQEAV